MENDLTEVERQVEVVEETKRRRLAHAAFEIVLISTHKKKTYLPFIKSIKIM